MKKLAHEVNGYLEQKGRKALSVEEIALGFIHVANEEMCRPIRALTQVKKSI